jgi:hypothetical protein
MYTIIALAVIVGVIFLFRKSSSSEEDLIVACIEHGGVFSTATHVCTPTDQTPLISTTSNTSGKTGTTSGTAPRTTTPSSTGGSFTGQATLLPTYYAQQISSSTLPVHVSTPPSNSIMVSPIIVNGEAKGSWYFEGTFPILLVNASGRIIASGHVQARSDWMTNDFVPFAGTLAFPRQSSGSKGFLILKKDNPSGLAKNDAAVEIPVTF